MAKKSHRSLTEFTSADPNRLSGFATTVLLLINQGNLGVIKATPLSLRVKSGTSKSLKAVRIQESPSGQPVIVVDSPHKKEGFCLSGINDTKMLKLEVARLLRNNNIRIAFR